MPGPLKLRRGAAGRGRAAAARGQQLKARHEELKAAAAQPAPGTIVDSRRSTLNPFPACPKGSKAVALPSDKDYYYSLCIAEFTDVAASASSSAAAAAAAVAAAAAAAVCFLIAAEAVL